MFPKQNSYQAILLGTLNLQMSVFSHTNNFHQYCNVNSKTIF